MFRGQDTSERTTFVPDSPDRTTNRSVSCRSKSGRTAPDRYICKRRKNRSASLYIKAIKLLIKRILTDAKSTLRQNTFYKGTAKPSTVFLREPKKISNEKRNAERKREIYYSTEIPSLRPMQSGHNRHSTTVPEPEYRPTLRSRTRSRPNGFRNRMRCKNTAYDR